MITKNYKKCMAGVLTGTTTRFIPIRTVSGAQTYTGLSRSGAWPSNDVWTTVTLNAASAGISVGSGTSPETDDSYQLDNTITTGLSLSASASFSVDQNENPILTRLVTVTNTSSADITVSEIGYKISVNVGTGNGNILVDRTLLETPITIPAGASATITYKIKFMWNNG